MTIKTFDGLCNDGLYRIRNMKSIVDQIKEDYSELSHLWEGSKNGPIDKYQEEECLRLVCWLRNGLSLFKGLRHSGIEGLCCGEIDVIAKDIQDKEKILGLNKDYFNVSPPSQA